MARRVLSTDGGTKVEVSFESNGKLLGVSTRAQSPIPPPSGQTEASTAKPENSRGQRRRPGHVRGPRSRQILDGGGVSYRGAQYFYGDTPKLSGLNRIAVVFEYEADAEGNTKTKLLEWK